MWGQLKGTNVIYASDSAWASQLSLVNSTCTLGESNKRPQWLTSLSLCYTSTVDLFFLPSFKAKPNTCPQVLFYSV